MKLLAVMLIALSIQAQTPAPILVGPVPPLVNRYAASASTTKLTIQAPVNPGIVVVFEQITVYCSSGSTITESWGGTAATATAATATKGNQVTKAAIAIPYTGSDVGAGTTLATYTIPAGSTFTFDGRGIQWSSSGPIQNYTFATSNSCTIKFIWREQ